MAATDKNMNFDVNLLPVTTGDHNLGSSSLKWNLFVNQINGATPVTGVKGSAENNYRTGQVNLTAANVGAVATSGKETVSGIKTLKFTSRIYPLVTGQERSQWYKITFPFSTITTSSSAAWFMNSFDLHFGGGYNQNPSGVAHVAFYWYREKENGAWFMSQGSAKIEGILVNKIKFYYRIAEPAVLYVNNIANTYNGIWLDNLYVDDTSVNLNWANTTIETCSAITISDYQNLPTVYTYSGNNDSNYYIDNNTTVSGTLTATSFSGPLTGNVTGNVSGTASNVTSTVAIDHGGTGATTAADARTNLGVAASDHTHGNITNAGAITSTEAIANGDKITIINASDNSKLIGTTITFDGSTATKALTQKGTWETFNNYSHPTTDGNKHVPANGTTNNGKYLQATGTAGTYQWADLPAASTTVAGITTVGASGGAAAYSHGNHVPAVQTADNAKFLRNDNSWQTVTPANIGAAASTHTHGNIQSGGALQTTDITIASGDKLVVTDSSDSNKVARTSISFDASTDTKALTQKGTWETFLKATTAFTGKPTGNQTPGFGGTFTIQQISQSNVGQVSGTDRTVTIPSTIATNTAVGLVKPWYTHTVASTGPTTGNNSTAVAVNTISTTTGKYYAIEGDSNGRLFVNVPWTDNNTLNTAGSTNSTSKLFLIGATSQAANPTTNSYVYTYVNNGLLSSTKLGLNASGTEKAHLEWNATDLSIDFVFN